MATVEIDFEREREWWDAKADRERVDLADERVNRLLRWRILERFLPGVKTILDVGGGTGAFSIPLARRGFEVTHMDFSLKMLELARLEAGDLPNIRFEQANAAELSRYPDQAFDLVLNLDGAISFCGSAAEHAIAESCRVARNTAILSVSTKAWMIPVWLSESIKATGRIVPAVKEMLHNGFWHRDQFAENAEMVSGYLGTLKAFLPDELTAIVKRCGMEVTELRGLGTLANLASDVLQTVLRDDRLLEEFLDLCDEYDLHIDPLGPGTRQRAGLIAVAQRLG